MVSVISQTEALRKILTRLNTVATDRLLNLFGSMSDAQPAALYTSMAQVVPDFAHQFVNAAALTTAQWYDELNPSSSYSARIPPAEQLVAPERIKKSLRWSVFSTGSAAPVDRMAGSLQRMIFDGSRKTVLYNAASEHVRWTRVARPDACEFCRVLATRGFVYHTQESARKGHTIDANHDHCYCTAWPDRGRAKWVEPEYYALFRAEYNAAVDSLPPSSFYTDKGSNAYLKAILAKMREQSTPDVVEPSPGTVVVAASDSMTALSDALTISDALAAAEALVPSIEWKPPAVGDLSVGQVKSTVLAVYEFVQKYPDVKIGRISFDPSSDDGEYGYTKPYEMADQYLGVNYINMGESWMRKPDELNSKFQSDIDDNFHYPFKPQPVDGESFPDYRKRLAAAESENKTNAAYAIMWHELGHAINWNTKTSIPADKLIAKALSSYYLSTRGSSATSEDAMNWIYANLSGYSFNNVLDAILKGIKIEPREAIAEAFADVEINGDRARETSKVLHKILVDAHNGIEFDPDQQWPDFRPETDPDPINYFQTLGIPVKKAA